MTEKMPDEIYAWRGYQDNGSWETSDVVDGVTPTDGVYYVRKDLIPQWNEDMESAPVDCVEFIALARGCETGKTKILSPVYYDELGRLLFDGDYISNAWDIIAWMPLDALPTPPQSGEKEGV